MQEGRRCLPPIRPELPQPPVIAETGPSPTAEEHRAVRLLETGESPALIRRSLDLFEGACDIGSTMVPGPARSRSAGIEA